KFISVEFTKIIKNTNRCYLGILLKDRHNNSIPNPNQRIFTRAPGSGLGGLWLQLLFINASCRAFRDARFGGSTDLSTVFSVIHIKLNLLISNSASRHIESPSISCVEPYQVNRPR